MQNPELIFVTECNAAGKSSFIRTRINELPGFEIIMTDVYKGRSKDIFFSALSKRKNIIIETVFNDASFKDLIDKARDAGYQTSMIVLFLDSLQHSIERVAFRSIEQSGLTISDGNIKINFNESFKNIATYFFYFDYCDFIYTCVTEKNSLIMSFERTNLVMYKSPALNYPQKFASYSFNNNSMNEDAYQIVTANNDYK